MGCGWQRRHCRALLRWGRELVGAEKSGTDNELRHIIAGTVPGTLIAVGTNDTIVRSSNGGENWDLVVDSRTKSPLRRVIAHQGVLIAVGDQGTVIRSKDNGATWLPAENSGTPENLERLVAASDGVLIACGNLGTIVRSTE